MNEYTRKRQQRGQQQVRQLSIAATLMTTLMILVFHNYKVAISTYSTYLKLLISPIRFIVSTQWLLIIAVSVMSASLGYILGPRIDFSNSPKKKKKAIAIIQKTLI